MQAKHLYTQNNENFKQKAGSQGLRELWGPALELYLQGGRRGKKSLHCGDLDMSRAISSLWSCLEGKGYVFSSQETHREEALSLSSSLKKRVQYWPLPLLGLNA